MLFLMEQTRPAHAVAGLDEPGWRRRSLRPAYEGGPISGWRVSLGTDLMARKSQCPRVNNGWH